MQLAEYCLTPNKGRNITKVVAISNVPLVVANFATSPKPPARRA